jgi:hypothetical protein
MIEAALLQLAQSAVSYAFGKLVEGALQAGGGDAYKATAEKLRNLLGFKLGGTKELKEVQSNPKALEQLIAKEASIDPSFKQYLQGIIQELDGLRSTQSPPNQVQQTNQIIDSTVENSTFIDINQSPINSQGSVNIGGTQNSGDSFRR